MRRLVTRRVAAALVVVSVGSAGSAQHPPRRTSCGSPRRPPVTTWDPVKSFSTEVVYMANLYEPLVYANPPGAVDPVPAGSRHVVVEERGRQDLDVPSPARASRSTTASR